MRRPGSPGWGFGRSTRPADGGMAALDPAVAAVRGAVREHLLEPPPSGGPVLVACSGGPDSLALASATAHVSRKEGWAAGLITVDHQLQHGSTERAESVAAWARAVGLDPVLVVPVAVAGRPGGPEAAAREARYEALVGAARTVRAPAVLLGHTEDDQAETVLLALLRGSGPRGIAGMPVRRCIDGVVLLRPLLGISRRQTRTACTALGLTPWEDPHNQDPAFARTRARGLLESLVDSLGPAVVGNLARTAAQIAADTAALDAWAARVLDGHLTNGGRLDCGDLATLPDAVRGRVLHGWALRLGSPGTDLSHRHVAALDALVTAWHGQGAVHLPGALVVARRAGWLLRLEGPAC